MLRSAKASFTAFESDLCSKVRIIGFPNSKNKMFKYLVVIIYSVCVAASSDQLNQSLSEGFHVQKFRTNYQSGWSM